MLVIVKDKTYWVTVDGDKVKAQPAKDGKPSRGKPRHMNMTQAQLLGFVPEDYVAPVQPELPLPVTADEPPAVAPAEPETGLPVEDTPF